MERQELQRVFTHVPQLKTERLFLRKIQPGDAMDMFSYSKDSDVTKYLLWDPHPDEDYTRQYVEYLQERYEVGDFFDWAIIHAQHRCMIGTCGFTRILPQECAGEVGYVLNPLYKGKGYAREALSAVLDFGFSRLGLHRIYARIIPQNVPSIRVAEACGMQREGVLRESVFLRGEYRDVAVYAKLSTE